MSHGLNRAELLGRLGGDPDVRHRDGDKPTIVAFSVATTSSWWDKEASERRERTDWHRVTVFGPAAGVAAKYLRKGSQVYLAGELRTTEYTDREGQKRSSTGVEVRFPTGQLVLIGEKRGGSSSDIEDAPDDRQSSDQHSRSTRQDLDDEIPF